MSKVRMYFQPSTVTPHPCRGGTFRMKVTDAPKTIRTEWKERGESHVRMWKKAKEYKLRDFTLNGKTRKIWWNMSGERTPEQEARQQQRMEEHAKKGEYSAYVVTDFWYELHAEDPIYYKGRPFYDERGIQWIVRETWTKWCGAIPMIIDDGLEYKWIRIEENQLERFIKVPKTDCGMKITEMRASAIHNPFDGPADPILADLRTMRIDLNESIAMEAMKPARVASRFERYGDDWDLAA